MGTALELMRTNFVAVESIEQLRAFETQYGMSSDGVIQSDASRVLSVTEAVVDGVVVRATHRWYDPSGPFQNEPDMNKVKLEMDGMSPLEISFTD